MKNESVTIEIPGIPPTSNHAYVKAGRGWFPSKELKEWRALVAEVLGDGLKILDSEWFEVERTYYMPIYYKNGNKKKLDTSNRDKYCDDELCKYLKTYEDRQLDDHEIIDGSHGKRDCKVGEERTVWTIWGVGESV